jgi:hypothetical protein
MTDPYRHQSGPEPFGSEGTLVYRGSTIRLRQTDGEWIAVINRPAERHSIILAADREAVMAKAQPCIEAYSCVRQEHP